MRNFNQWFSGLVGVILLFIITYIAQVYLAAKGAGEIPNFSETDPQVWLRVALLAIFMLIGVVCNYVFDRAKKATEDSIDIRDELIKMLSNPKFIMAIVIAPLTFNSIYVVIGDNPQTIGDYLLAFQNGFFWQSVISTTINTRSSMAQPNAAKDEVAAHP